MKVFLEPAEWQAVINILVTAPWHQANPLLTKITKQLQDQDSKQQTNNEEVLVPQGFPSSGEKLSRQ